MFFWKFYRVFKGNTLFRKMAEDDDAWNKLPAYDKVQHNNWKCRKAGYEALIQKELPILGTRRY